ncbi:hypothetical protein BH10PAT1_BH10PAT1_1780 [soil metagenome]
MSKARKKINPKKFRLIFGGILLLILVIFVGLKLWTNNRVKAAWFDDSYGYRKLITFTHNAALTNRRVTITIDTATLITAGKMQSNCADSRFTDINGQLLQYQLTASCNNASTTYDVVFPTIINGANNGYFYYGNPLALSMSQDVSGFTSLSPSGGSPAFATEEKGTGPVGYWKFDEGTDNTCQNGTDDECDSIKSNNMTSGSTTAAPTWQTEDLCVSGKCLFLDGSNDYAEKTSPVGLPSGNVAKTISGWFRTGSGSTGGHEVMFGFGDPSSAHDFQFGIYSSHEWSVFGYGSGNDWKSSVTDSSYTDNKWHFATITYDGTTTKMYFDGVLKDSTSSFSWNTTTTAATIGSQASSHGSYYNGFIDDFKIYSYARSQAQINTDYIKGATSKGSSAVLGMADQSYLSNGLVGYWKMDETSWTNDCSTATVTDSSGNANNLKSCPNTTGPTGGGVGKFGNGGTFDGSNDYLDLTTAVNLPTTDAAQTISVWYKVASNPAGAQDMVHTEGGFDEVDLGFKSSNIIVSKYGGTTLVSATPPTAGVWNHIVYVFDGLTHYLYINGVLQNTSTVSPNTGWSISHISIGSNKGVSQFFSGTLDDVRYYNRALSPAEVNNLYNWAPGPINYWNFDANNGTTAYDRGTSNDNGSFNGSLNANSWIPGKFGSALTFNGSSDYVGGTLSPTLANSSFSISGWIYQNLSPSGDQTWFRSGSVAGTDTLLHLRIQNTGLIRMGFYADDLDTATGVFVPGQWNYVSYTFDASSKAKKIYYNGVLVASGTASGNFSGNGTYSIGSSAGSEFWNGKIDEVKIYNYVTSPSQIIENMNGGHPVGGSPIGSQIIKWSLDEQNGSTVNNSGFGAPSYGGTTSGTSWLTNTACKINGCLNFSGTTNNVAAGSPTFFDGLTTMSVTFWMNSQTAFNSNYSVISKIDSSSNAWQIRTTGAGDQLRIVISNAATDTSNYCVTSGLAFTLSTWQHVAVVYDGTAPTGSNIKVYLNGVAWTCSVTGTIPTAIRTSTATLRLGQNAAGGSGFIGYLDEVKIYNTALTASQVLIDYNQGLSVNYGVGGPLESSVSSDGTGAAPVGYWPFEENTGTTANDKSGNGNTGTLTNGPIWATGKIGQAINFDGADDVVDAGSGSNLDDLSSMTLEAWIYPRSLGGGSLSRIMEKAATVTTLGWRWQLNSSNSIIFAQDYAGTDLSRTSANNVFSLNTWSHVVVTWTGSSTATTIHIYVNGVETGYGTTTNGTSTRVSDAAQTLKIGNTTDGTRGFNGLIDDAKVFNYVRTPAQIAYDYNRGTPIAWWQFDECQGSTMHDASGNGFNGTWHGSSGSQTSVGTCNTSSTAWGNGATGKFNSSLNFDGTDDFVDVYSSGFNSAFNGASGTVSLWAKVTDSSVWTDGASRTLAYFKVDANNKLIFYKNSISNEIEADYYAGGVGNGDFIATSTTDWFNFVVTWDKTADKFIHYFNGKQIQSFSGLGTWAGNLDSVSTGIGASDQFSDNPWKGQIDDVRVYNYALSPTQIKTIYNDAFSVFYGPVTGSP